MGKCRGGDLRGPMSAIAVARRMGRWGDATASLQDLDMRSLEPDTILLGAVLSASAKAQRWDLAFWTLSTTSIWGLKADVIMCNEVLDSYAKGQQWLRASALADEMLCEHLQPDMITHNSVVTACERGLQWRAALALVLGMWLAAGPDVVSCSGCAGACSRCQQWRQALHLFSQDMRGVRPDVMGLTSALNLAGRALRWPAALHVESHARHRGIQFDVAAVNALLSSGVADGGWWKRAAQLLSDTLMDRLRRDAVTVGAVLVACQGGQQWDRAAHTLKGLRYADIELSAVGLNTAILASRAGANEKRAWLLALDSTMEMRGMQLDVVGLNAMAGTCAEGSIWARSIHLIVQTKLLALEPTAVTNVIATSSLVRASCWTLALGSARNHGQWGQPSVTSGNVLASACERGLKWELALRLSSRMKIARLQPDGSTAAVAISACETSLRWELAVGGLADVPLLGSEPSTEAYNAALSAGEKGRRWELALVLLVEMCRHVLRPDAVSYNAVTSACGARQQLELALQLLREMRWRGFHPDAFSYTFVVGACAKRSKWQGAVALCEEMRESGLETGTAALNAALAAIQASSDSTMSVRDCRWRRAVDMWVQMWRNGPQPDVVTYGAASSTCGINLRWQEAGALLVDLRRTALQASVVGIAAVVAAGERAVRTAGMPAALAALLCSPVLCTPPGRGLQYRPAGQAK